MSWKNQIPGNDSQPGLSSWAELKQYDDTHDEEYFREQNQQLEEEYGPYVKLKYIDNGRLGYYCEICDAEMNAESSLISHCRGMKHLKNKNKVEEMSMQTKGILSDDDEEEDDDQYTEPQVVLPEENPTENMTTTEKLIYKLSSPCMQANDDAALAVECLNSLANSLKKYYRDLGEVETSDLFMEMELKYSTVKALSSTNPRSAFSAVTQSGLRNSKQRYTPQFKDIHTPSLSRETHPFSDQRSTAEWERPVSRSNTYDRPVSRRNNYDKPQRYDRTTDLRPNYDEDEDIRNYNTATSRHGSILAGYENDSPNGNHGGRSSLSNRGSNNFWGSPSTRGRSDSRGGSSRGGRDESWGGPSRGGRNESWGGPSKRGRYDSWGGPPTRGRNDLWGGGDNSRGGRGSNYSDRGGMTNRAHQY